jgi:superoxide reductase
MDKLYVCKNCGHIAFAEAPEKCPVCGVGKSNYNENPQAVHPAEKEGKEKHVPAIVVTDTCGLIPQACKDVHIKVGSTPHPMEPEHWIEWIDVYINHVFSARYSMQPQALQAAVGVHLKSEQSGIITAIEHCNKHGTWMSEAKL